MPPSGGICQACRAGLLASQRARLPHLKATSKSSMTILQRTYTVNARMSPFRSSQPLLSSRISTKPSSPFTPSSLIRFQSTSPATGVDTQSPTAPGTVPDLTPSTSVPSYDFLPPGASSLETQLLTGKGDGWYVGYLKDLDLDFGWGPTSMIQALFELVHSNAGTVFSGSIMITALIVRLCFFPLLRSAADQGARLRSIAKLIAPTQAKMKLAMQEGDQLEFAKQRQLLMGYYQRSGFKFYKMMLPFLQVPVGFGSWRLLRNMAELPVPGMTTGGLSWCQNLAAPDPYYVLPFLTAFFQHMAIRLGGESGADNPNNARMRFVLMWVLPPFVMFITQWIPAAVQLSFATTAALSTVTATLFRSPRARQILKMHPIPTPVAPKPPPYKGTMNVAGRSRETSSDSQTAGASSASAGSQSGILGSTISNIKSKFEGARKTVMSSYGDQKTKTATKNTKSKATQYEERRRKEIDAERAQFEQEMRKYHKHGR